MSRPSAAPSATTSSSSVPGSAASAAKALKRADVDVTLIARTTTHLFQPLLYQVATGILSEGEIAPTTRGPAQAGERPGAARRGRTIDLAGARPSPRVWRDDRTPFDSLIVAAGARSPTSATTTSPSSPPA